jgi:CRP-like cAMP-binding protein
MDVCHQKLKHYLKTHFLRFSATRRYPYWHRGQSSFWEGEPSAGIFLIIEGSVKIFRTSPSGRELMLA